MPALLYLVPYLFSAAISVWVGWHAWRRPVNGARHLAWLAFLEAEWSCTYALQLIVPELESKLFWNNAQFLGAIGAPLMYLAFALEYDRPFSNRPKLSWKYLIPVAAGLLGFVWMDARHGLFRGPIHLEAGEPFVKLVFVDGPGFALYTIYAYSLILLTTLLLVARYINASRLYRLQIGLVLLGIFIAWGSSVAAVLQLVPAQLHEITPVTFGLSNLIIATALFRYQLFDMVPIARDYLVENMSDAMLVLDHSYRLVDANRSTFRILNTTADASLGLPIHEIVPVPIDWLKNIVPGNSSESEIYLSQGEPGRVFAMQVTHLSHPDQKASAYLVLLRDISERKRLEEQLRKLAITDSLTGIYNRRQILTLASQELNRAVRLEQELSLILFDIDHFKEINDAYGHQAGDRALRELTHTLQIGLRNFDLFGRYGGEEFLVILPATDSANAIRVAERLRTQAENLPVSPAHPQARLTISLGVTCLAGRTILTLDELISEADQALYRAKSAGRNRVEA